MSYSIKSLLDGNAVRHPTVYDLLEASCMEGCSQPKKTLVDWNSINQQLVYWEKYIYMLSLVSRLYIFYFILYVYHCIK